MTDEGEAYICGHPVSSQIQAAQQLTGYCPQFDGLPGQMTGAQPHLCGFPHRACALQRRKSS